MREEEIDPIRPILCDRALIQTPQQGGALRAESFGKSSHWTVRGVGIAPFVDAVVGVVVGAVFGICMVQILVFPPGETDEGSCHANGYFRCADAWAPST
jgi:hypothetical protein